jgi:hypothetical protein
MTIISTLASVAGLVYGIFSAAFTQYKIHTFISVIVFQVIVIFILYISYMQTRWREDYIKKHIKEIEEKSNSMLFPYPYVNEIIIARYVFESGRAAPPASGGGPTRPPRPEGRGGRPLPDHEKTPAP